MSTSASAGVRHGGAEGCGAVSATFEDTWYMTTEEAEATKRNKPIRNETVSITIVALHATTYR